MKVGDFFYLFSVEVVNKQGNIIKRLEFCDSIEKAGEAARKYKNKLKKNEEIWFVPYCIGQTKAEDPTFGTVMVDVFYPPKNDNYTKTYYESIKRQIRSSTPSSGYSRGFLMKPRITTPYAQKNNKLSNFVFTAERADENYHIFRKTKKEVSEGDIIVPYQRALCIKCWNNIKHCVCDKLPNVLVDVDENIQEAIILLNRKGYYTRFCCEGHHWRNPSAYISFVQRYKFSKELPNWWYEEGSIIRLDYKDALEENENFEEVKKRKMVEFLEWVESLPENTKSIIG